MSLALLFTQYPNLYLLTLEYRSFTVSSTANLQLASVVGEVLPRILCIKAAKRVIIAHQTWFVFVKTCLLNAYGIIFMQ